MTDFNPVEIMLQALKDADKNRLRITHWAINGSGECELAYRDGLNGFYLSSPIDARKPIRDREYMGIPVRFMFDWNHDEPRLEPVFEKRGGFTLVHDYHGDILHGNAYHRFQKKMPLVAPNDTIVACATVKSSHGEDTFLLTRRNPPFKGFKSSPVV